MSKKNEYILECPFCGQKHSIDKGKDKSLLSSPDKIFSVKCASDFTDRGCKNVIVICSQETLKKLADDNRV
jgi:hypothetical protein